jgi:RNA polymerase sigma-70 factor (ECF subfamily)
MELKNDRYQTGPCHDMHNRRIVRGNNGMPDQELPAAGQVDDETLARQARHDAQAFAELYRRYLDAVYRFHLVRTGGVAEAQDLTSQTFVAALESIDRYRQQGSFAGWLFGIARHKQADYYRRRRRDLPLESIETAPHPDPSPEQITTTHLAFEWVVRTLHTLTPDQAEALTLRLYGGLSTAEVSEIMGKSEAAVKMLVHRGLGRLQERLAFAEVSP